MSRSSEEREIRMLANIRVRDRRAMPMRVGIGIEGWLRWELIGRDGRVRKASEQHNLILDQGLDQIATYGVLGLGISSGESFRDASWGMTAFAVGTGTAAPAVSDTALVSEIARITTTSAPNTITRTSDGVYEIVRTFEVDFAVGNGVLTEWGIAPGAVASTADLYARELFRDTGGTPTAITKTSADKLRAIYTRIVTLTPTIATTASLSITGHGTVAGKYRLIGGDSSGDRSALDMLAFSEMARGVMPSTSDLKGGLWLPDSDLSGVAYNGTNVPVGGLVPGAANVAIEAFAAPPAYTPGSFTRDGGVLKFGTARGNFQHFGIAHVVFGNGVTSNAQIGFMFDYDPSEEWTKDNLHELRVTLPTTTWARA